MIGLLSPCNISESKEAVQYEMLGDASDQSKRTPSYLNEFSSAAIRRHVLHFAIINAR